MDLSRACAARASDLEIRRLELGITRAQIGYRVGRRCTRGARRCVGLGGSGAHPLHWGTWLRLILTGQSKGGDGGIPLHTTADRVLVELCREAKTVVHLGARSQGGSSRVWLFPVRLKVQVLHLELRIRHRGARAPSLDPLLLSVCASSILSTSTTDS